MTGSKRACSPAFVASVEHPLTTVSRPAAPAPWERRPDESASAFRAFTAYRDLGPERSLTKVAAQLGLVLQTCARFSRQFAWVTRANEADCALLDLQRVRSTEARLIAANDHAKAADALVAVTARRIARLLPEEVEVEAIPRLLRTGVEIARLARGERNEGAAPSGPPVNVQVGVRFGSAQPSWAGTEQNEAKGTSTIVETSNRGSGTPPASLREAISPKLAPKETKRKGTSRLAAKVHAVRKVKGPVQ